MTSVTRARAGRGGMGRAVFVTLVTLLVAASLELAVFGNGGHDALGDLPGRFFAWHLRSAGWPYARHPIEYPVVLGYIAAATSMIGRTAASFFVANGALNAGLAVAMTVALYEPGRPRIWRWAAGIPLALYAFHNWDLVAMLPAIVGLIAYEQGKYRSSGALLAVGASAKVFPGFFLVPLTCVRWCAGDRRGATRLAGAFLLTTVALNLPVAGSDWAAWTHPASFQGARAASWGSLWAWILRIPGLDNLTGGIGHGGMNVLAGAATLGALSAIAVLAVRRNLDAFAIGAAVTGAFLLTNKIYSPNYDLWIVPFFVLIPISKKVWVGFCASDLAVFVLVFGFLHGQWSVGVVDAILPLLVVARAATIVAVVLTALRANGDLDAGHTLRTQTRARPPGPAVPI